MTRSLVVVAAALVTVSATAAEPTYNDEGRQVPAWRATATAVATQSIVERSTVARAGFFYDEGAYARIVEGPASAETRRVIENTGIRFREEGTSAFD